ncbi:MAG: hypothetical protein HS111_12665 [Kofleriaceae bacterium]|nr:hypothetical protein [Kofleriaceae bacterium]MCL4224214.1 hypothetical protein [Myxococcales bacterium]
MRTTIASLVTAAVLGTSLAGCIQDNEGPHAVARVLPRAEDVRIKLPDTAAASAFAVGDVATWYVATRDVTRTLNGGTAFVLVLIHTIVLFPPTTVDGDTATWGPHSDPLDPAEWRLTVTAQGDGSYDWALDGRSKLAAGTAFETIIAGNAAPGGTGDFVLDFDAAERVNPIDNHGRGLVTVAYDLGARRLAMGIDTVEDLAGTPTDVHFDYAYAEGSDRSGDMVFTILADSADPGPEREEATLRSRWLATGAGRADVRLRNGDLEVEVTASECWNTMFRRVFYTDSASWLPTEGDAADCAFADVDLP